MTKGTAYKEIEYKYPAKGVSALKFIQFCRKKMKKDYYLTSGEDRFYENKADKDSFCRHRHGGDMNQLTFKKKLQEENNSVRIERNIDLATNVSVTDIEGFCEDLNFLYNFALKKKAFIFEAKTYIAVYYICYNEDNSELGRFIELELSEKIDWKNEKLAIKELTKIEKQFKVLGIGPKKRIKQSLWEMYRKPTKERKNNGI